MVNMEKVVQKIQKELDEKGVYAEVFQFMELPAVVVRIHWGDWKHEHLRAKWVMESLGAIFVRTEETETNGTDCYSADHYFIVDKVVA